jgi:hypothetical protein
MRTKQEPYLCPCCGYKTSKKGNMRAHLYKSKTPCPKLRNDIELTNEIKEYVLQNRIYKIANVPMQQVINQTINNYNVIQNFISGMDVMDKLNKYMEYNKKEIIDFEDKVEESYMLTSKRLDEDKFKYGFELRTRDILEIIDKISSIPDNKPEYFNIIYDAQINKLKLYEEGAWKSMLIAQGIRQILIITQECLLNSYESFLMRKIKNNRSLLVECQKSKELLIEYYKFIGAFEIYPFCKEQNDSEIDTNCKDCMYEYQEEFFPYYQKALDKLTKSEINTIKKDLLEIVKRNTHQNIHELNKRVLALIHIDEEFKVDMLTTI